MKIYFNALGAISSTDTTDEAIRQGSVGNTIKAYFAGKNNSNFVAKLNYTRPDGSRLSGLIMTPSPSDSTLYTFVLNDEWYMALAGNATFTIYLYDGNGDVVAQGQVTYPIQETDYDGEPTITQTQYDSLLTALAGKLGMPVSSLRVDELPEEGMTGVFYIIHDDENDDTRFNIYVWNSTISQYLWVGSNELDLNKYYTKEEGNQFESDVIEEIDGYKQVINSRVSSVEDELSSVASGSPAGTYADVASLTAAHPTGDNNIYVCLDTGDWYYWNGSAWTSGGTYLSTGVRLATDALGQKLYGYVSTSAVYFDFPITSGNTYIICAYNADGENADAVIRSADDSNNVVQVFGGISKANPILKVVATGNATKLLVSPNTPNCSFYAVEVKKTFGEIEENKKNIADIFSLLPYKVEMFKTIVNNSNQSTILSDLNNAKENTIYFDRLYASTKPNNFPTDLTFTDGTFYWIVTINGLYADGTNGTGMQAILDAQFMPLYTRGRNLSGTTITWGTWQKSSSLIVKENTDKNTEKNPIEMFKTIIRNDNQSLALSNLNNALSNTIYFDRLYASTKPNNFPTDLTFTDGTFYWILSLDGLYYNSTTQGTGKQIILSQDFMPLYQRAYNISSGTRTFGSWVKCSSQTIAEAVATLQTAVAELKQNPDKLLPDYFYDGNGEEIGFVGRWWKKTINNVEQMVTTNAGSQFYIRVLNATYLTISFNNMGSETGYFAYKIDNGSVVRQLITNNTITIPDTGFHNILILIDSLDGSGINLGTEVGIGVISATSDGEIRGILPYSKRIAFFGDSITNGINNLGTSATPADCSAYQAYPFVASLKCGFTPFMSAFGGSGASHGGAFGSKFATQVIKLSQTRYVGDYHIDMAIVNHGYNDAGDTSETFIADYKAGLENIFKLYPTMPVVILVPFAQTKRTELLSIYNDYKDTHNIYFCETANWGLETTDGSHPTATSQITLGTKLAEWLVETFGKDWFLKK